MPELKMTQREFLQLPVGEESSAFVVGVGENIEGWLVSITRGVESSFINWGNDWTTEGVLYPNHELSFLPKSPDVLDVIDGDAPLPEEPSPGWLKEYELEQMSIQDAEQC